MDIFWPGMVMGPAIVVICVFAYRKRGALSRFANSVSGTFIGDTLAKRLMADPKRTEAALILPIFGGIALGSAILIMSLTSVMA